jgi:hypothetical protein
MGASDHHEQTVAALQFFGIVTASVSHELNNVNSTIEQIAGLLEDHLAGLQSGKEIDPDRLRDVHQRIRRQTRRAAEIIERLNRFAHTADDPRARFELGGLLEILVGICRRLSQQRRVELQTAARGEEIWLEGDPFQLARTIFDDLVWFWTSCPTDSVIEAAAGREADRAVVRLAGPLAEPDAEPTGPPPSGDCAVSGDRRTITIAVPCGSA